MPDILAVTAAYKGVLPARAAVQLDRLDRDSLLHLLADKPTLLWFTPYTGWFALIN